VQPQKALLVIDFKDQHLLVADSVGMDRSGVWWKKQRTKQLFSLEIDTRLLNQLPYCCFNSRLPAVYNPLAIFKKD